jgi:hypothetical protein
MTSQKNLDDIKHIIHITTWHEPFCEFCEDQHSRKRLHSLDFAVNHYIEKHGYKLLYLGQETNIDQQGNFLNCTVAVVGK